MKKLMTWWHSTNETMTRLCGDADDDGYEPTNGELLLGFAGCVVVMFIVGIAG